MSYKFTDYENHKRMEYVKFTSRYDCLEVYEGILADKLLKDRTSRNKREKDDIVQHSKYVMMIATEIAESYELEDLRAIHIASLLHDISKYENNENHHILGSRYILENTIVEDQTLRKLVAEIVAYHKGGKPEEGLINLRMCQIVHDADKISKLLKEKNWKDGKPKSKAVDSIKKKLQLEESEKVLTRYLSERSIS